MKEMKNVKSRYDFSLDNRQVVLIVSGLILVLMMSFLMGTLFGKNLSQMADSGGQAVAVNDAEKTPAPAVAGAEEPAPVADNLSADAEPAAPQAGDSATREEYIKNLESMKVPSGTEPAPAEPSLAPPVMGKLNPTGPPRRRACLNPLSRPSPSSRRRPSPRKSRNPSRKR